MMGAARFSNTGWASSLFTAVILVGCAEGEPNRPAQPATKAAVVAVQPTKSEPQQATGTSSHSSKAFEPPFPERQELFAPPDPGKVASSQQRAPLSVALRGFVDFEGRCVLLEIDGKVNVLRAGQECQGIEVISIDPPGVTLQSGGHRWTAQLISL